MIKIKSDKIIVGETLFDGYMYVLNGKIAEISKVDKPCKESYDYTGKYVSAGFIDMHTHTPPQPWISPTPTAAPAIVTI